MRTRSTVSMVIVTIVALALAGCGPKKTAATPTPSAGLVSAATTATPGATTGALPANGKCVLLTADQATALLGSVPKSSAGGHGSGKIVHIDGCSYITAAGSLGYDVNDYAAAGFSPALIITQAKLAMSKVPGSKPFTVPGTDASLGFTLAIPGRTMARIEIAKGTYTISVNAIAGDPAKARQIALEAASILVTATG